MRGRVDAAFVDLGEKELKNIARPVRVYSVRPGAEIATPTPAASAPNKPEPPHLSIVVLPFASMTGDPEQEYFVDGVTESLTTDLSRIAGAFVIARNTAFAFRGRHGDVREIGRELNVRYVLEGSVQRAGSRMRVNVQLIDAERGAHLWAERFDKPVADLFDLQDEIVARLANALSAQLFAAEARRAERKPNPDSLDLTFQGWAWSKKGFTPDSFATARGLFERAAALDPTNVWALVGVAAVDLQVALGFFADDRAGRLAAAETALNRALSVAAENALAHLLLGVVQMNTDRASQGVRSWSGRWNWIETWPARTHKSATANFSSAKPRRPRLTSRGRSASALATRMPTYGACLPAWPSFTSARRKRQSLGCAGRSKPIEVSRPRISFWRPPWRVSGGSC